MKTSIIYATYMTFYYFVCMSVLPTCVSVSGAQGGDEPTYGC